MRLIYIFFILYIGNTAVFAQVYPLQTKDSVAQMQWVNGQYNKMTLQQKIGQLFMVSVASDQSKAATDKISNLITTHGIGGVIFSTGGPKRQAKLTNTYQSKSSIPLLIGMDAEWGLAMRLDSTYAFPWNMTLGAIQDNAIVSKVGKQIGQHAKRLGVHINFAPDIDINTNPKNPIIGNRSFGEDKQNVTEKGIAFMQGMESVGVLSTGKHFPGHGDTAVDSHLALPTVNFTKQRLDSVELYPFKQLISKGLSSIMVAHLEVPALEMKKGLPSSLSEQIISGLLKEQLDFQGLIFTDALNMKGVANSGKNGSVEYAAFMAGNDILLMPTNIEEAIQKLVNACDKGELSENRLAYSVKKILMAKYKAGLHEYAPIEIDNLYTDLNTLEDDIVYEEAIEHAITVVKNENEVVGIKNLETKKIAYVKFGDANNTDFVNELKKYTTVTVIDGTNSATLKNRLTEYNLIIIGHHKSNESPWKSYKFTSSEKVLLKEIATINSAKVLLCVFAKPYALGDLNSFNGIDGVVVGYQNSAIAQQKTAQVLFGALPAKGKLPVTVHPEFEVGIGITTPSLKRLGYSVAKRVGMNATILSKIDTLVQHGLDSLMFPGAQVLVARKGKVIYSKSFGKATYSATEKITNDHMYDLASLTKILATLPMVMKMEEEGKIKLNDTFETLEPRFSNTEIKNVTVLKALSHYARLPAWIPFYIPTLDKNKKPSVEFYRTLPTPGFSNKVAENLYITDAYKDSISNRIGRQDLKSNRYRYSDVPYYVMKKYIEDTYQRRLDTIAKEFLYQRIGANHTAFNPLEQFLKSQIVPSEEDTYYRYQTVQGYVHDMGAAMQGGVGGHAGLFSNANDIAKIMQMYLQDGEYGGTSFFDSRTIKKFNTCYFCDRNVRRGVGFDKPQLQESGPTCGCVSRKSFGHSGFTGTYTWADPDKEIVYVFLSNRTYPTASNTLLVKSGLRTRIQQIIYDALLN